jgi:RNA polymerase sigma-70 factor (ECF subfamily)
MKFFFLISLRLCENKNKHSNTGFEKKIFFGYNVSTENLFPKKGNKKVKISQLSDEELIHNLQKIMNKNSSEFEILYEELFQRYSSQVYSLCRYYGLQHDDSCDVLQETFIKLVNFIKSFRENSLFKPWFFKIVLNLVRNKYNDLKKHNFISIEEISSTTPFNEENFDIFHNREVIIGILNRIPREFKEVILLRIYGEMKIDEIARVLNISARQVYNRLNKGYELVRKFLEKEE